MEQKHNKQLHAEEYFMEYSAHEQQLIYEVIFGIFQEHSWNILHVRPGPKVLLLPVEYISIGHFVHQPINDSNEPWRLPSSWLVDKR